MNKARAGMVLSAAAVANLAVVGFVTSPGDASIHTPAASTGADTTAKVVPSAGKAHPGLLVIPAGKARSGQLSPRFRQAIARANRAASTRPRGFVPRTSSGVKPDTASGCSGHVCIGVISKVGGKFVSSIREHFFDASGCQWGNVFWNGSHLTASHCVESNVTVKEPSAFSLANSAYICASFGHVSGVACVAVDR
jgi:hypothetical protein